MKRVAHREMRLRGGGADHRVRAPLPGTDRLEPRKVGRPNRQHVAFLRLVAPDFQRRHSRFRTGNRAQVEQRTDPCVVDELRQGIGEPARADIVHRDDGVRGAQALAAVKHLLRPPLHFWVRALNAGKVQLLPLGALCLGTGRPTAEANPHAWSAQHHNRVPRLNRGLQSVIVGHIAQPPGDHDGLVVAAPHRFAGRLRQRLLERPEEAAQVGAPEFVVERGGADGGFQHDLEGAGDPVGVAGAVDLPRFGSVGKAQVGDHVATHAHLRLTPAPHRAFVADLPAGAGAGPGMGTDRSGMVVGLHLHQQVQRSDLGALPHP